MSRTHVLPANEKTLRTGVVDRSHPPVLTVESGDTVDLATGTCWGDVVRPGMTMADVLRESAAWSGVGPHDLTGPIAVAGAEPGDALKVEVLGLTLREHAFNLDLPGHMGYGLLPEDFRDGHMRHYRLDLEEMSVELGAGLTVPLAPFPGFLGTAPAAAGPHSSVPPGGHGGNLDLKELVAGSSLYLPVWTEGALLYAGDIHAAQGNGEVNLTALEASASSLRLRLTVIPDAGIRAPRAETPAHLITMGFGATLDEAARMATRDMIVVAGGCLGIPASDAYALCSMTMDLAVTQTANGAVGVHAMLPKHLAGTPSPEILVGRKGR
ncbi:acetamidase/formamidase family protein [Actinomadura geliboluensis]|uniref:Amidase n=1 Tax=Actinomadura geliboluensis TaxID=882440 RepID=A0A5S4H0A7_9ACTN|nr:acetamidase/formamidase family protein [Actinomadura geliboluensis]TMR38668.1 amidase [Actinomadura geliboluensis]